MARAGLLQEPKSCLNQLEGQVGKNPARAKTQRLGVDLVSKEGWGQLSEDLNCLAKHFGFCPASEGEPWIAHAFRRNAVLWGGPPRVLGRGWLVTLRAGLTRTLVIPQTHGSHPCWPRGYSTHVMLWDVYESPCTAAQRPQAFNRSARVSLAGSSDPALCHSLVSQLFDSSSCHFSRCSFNGVFQPPVAGKFIVSPEDRKVGGLCPEVPGVWSQCDCTRVPGLLCFLLHDGLPENGDGAACGNSAATRGGCSHPLQPDME